MSLVTKEYRIEGISPLLMHNGQLADPMSDISKEMKKVSSKKGKTEEDQIALAEMEFRGSLYLNDKLEPCIPGEMLEACIINGSKKIKKAPKFRSTLLCDGLWNLEYKGPKDIDALWEDKNFRDRRGVVINRMRIFRTRPRFNQWALTFTLTWDSDLIDKQDVDQALEIAGRECGLGDYRPRYGRFNVVK